MSEADDLAPMPRTAKGKRPQFFADPAMDHMLAMILELSAELSATRERLASLESLMATKGVMADGELEGYQVPDETAGQMAQRRQEFVQRLFRTIEVEAGSRG